MKLSGGDSDILGMPVESLLMNSWNPADIANSDVRHFLIGEDTKLALGGDTDDDDDDERSEHKSNALDDLDLLLTATTTSGATIHPVGNNTLAELKPLPPFTGYTGHLSINGISGHHYHTIAAAPNSPRILIETNNNSVETTNQNNVPYYPTDHVVSSSTIDNAIDNIKAESIMEYNLATDMDEDIAAIIGSAMADTTVRSGNGNHDGDDSRDSWLDLDAWIGSACGQSNLPPSSGKSNAAAPPSVSSESIQEFVANSQFSIIPSPPPAISFHHLHQLHHHHHHHHQQQQQNHPHLKSHPQQQMHTAAATHHQQTDINSTFPHMPLLQNRLQNGPPKPVEAPAPQSNASAAEITYNIVSECPSPSSSTQYLSAHSPPCHVVSTSDIGFIQVHSSTRPSPELQVSFPHTTTPSKKSRSRSKAKSMSSSIVYNEGNLGKEKTVHRCSICNRGFLNKSNIKVHLRTHTGEKPFRCEICGKAFRQKAHLIKHAQIHKRIGRD